MALIAVLSAIKQYTELIKHQKIHRSDTLKTFGQILSLIILKINKYKRLRDPEAKKKLQLGSSQQNNRSPKQKSERLHFPSQKSQNSRIQSKPGSWLVYTLGRQVLCFSSL